MPASHPEVSIDMYEMTEPFLCFDFDLETSVLSRSSQVAFQIGFNPDGSHI